MDALLPYLALYAAGLVAGTLNVLAGGGSLLTLPVMIFLGLPPTVANGTNRVAILAQNLAAVGSFRRRGLFEGAWLKLAGPPAVVGAILGAWTAVEIGDAAFEDILAGVMVGVAAWTLLRPPKSGAASEGAGPGQTGRRPGAAGAGAAGSTDDVGLPRGGRARAGLVVAFFGIGFYGGFIQAGLGFLILAVTTAAGLDLVRGNAFKVLLVLVFTPLVLLLFSSTGKVDWGMGVALAAGNVSGALLGVHLTVLKGHAWIRRVVVVMAVVFAVALWVR